MKPERKDLVTQLQVQRDECRAALQALREKLVEVRQERNERIKELQLHLRDARRELGAIDERDIDPRRHNTVHSMNSFFSREPEVERYEEFADALKVKLKAHQVTLNGKDILDVGVGPGYVLSRLLKHHSPRAIHGIDFSEVAIDNCRQLMSQGEFSVRNIYDPLPGKYDVVFCTEVLEHLENPDAALNRILKALNPRGVAILTVPDGRIDVSRLHINFWSPESWEIFLSDRTRGYGLTVDSFQVRETSRYRNNLAIIRRQEVEVRKDS